MSDQKTTAGDGVHQNHWCEHEGCNAWGGFGFSPKRSDPPTWRCWEHFLHKVPTEVPDPT